MSKHTPGPWMLDSDSAPSDAVGLVGANGHTIAEIRKTPNFSANARLIAAAPEMLEALKTAERTIEHRRGDCYSNDYMGVCVCGKDKIKQAIAKAEGK